MRVYDPSQCAIFRRSSDEYGALGNMAGGYPIAATGRVWKSTEALYQAARFPHRRDIQEDIRAASNGFTAKLVAKANKEHTRPDWMDVRVPIMLRCLYLKEMHVDIAMLLLRSGNLHIVEYSKRDAFWGAVPQPDGTLKGENTLGRLWEVVRDSPTCPTHPGDNIFMYDPMEAFRDGT